MLGSIYQTLKNKKLFQTNLFGKKVVAFLLADLNIFHTLRFFWIEPTKIILYFNPTLRVAALENNFIL